MFFVYWYASGIIAVAIIDYYDSQHDVLQPLFYQQLYTACAGPFLLAFGLWVIYAQEYADKKPVK